MKSIQDLVAFRIGNKNATTAILAAMGPALQQKALVLQRAEFHKMLARYDTRVTEAVNKRGEEDPSNVRGIVREALYYYCKFLLQKVLVSKLPFASKVADMWRDMIDDSVVDAVTEQIGKDALEGTDQEKVAAIIRLTRDAFAEKVF